MTDDLAAQGAAASVAPRLDTSVAHPARVYNYWLGGKAAANGYRRQVAPMEHRSHAEVGRFFAGLDLLDPGLVQLPEWRPDPGSRPVGPVAMWCGVACKRS